MIFEAAKVLIFTESWLALVAFHTLADFSEKIWVGVANYVTAPFFHTQIDVELIMAKYVAVGVLLVGAVFLVSNMGGCDGAKARLDVAASKAVQEIDKLLGEWDVKKQKVQNAYEQVQETTARVREERVKTQVRYDRAKKRSDKLVSDKAQVLSNIKKLSKMLGEAEASDDGEIERSGRTLTTVELNTMSKDQLTTLGLIKEQVKQASLEATALKKNLDILNRQQDTSAKQLKELKTKLAQIDTKMGTLKSMKTAQSISAPSKTINDEFNELTGGVDELLGQLDEELAVQEAKLDQRIQEMELDSTVDIDEILKDESDVSSTQAALEAALKEASE